MKKISKFGVEKSCRLAASPALGPRPPNRKRQVERMDGRPACVFAAMLIMAIVPRVMCMRTTPHLIRTAIMPGLPKSEKEKDTSFHSCPGVTKK